ncbi:hypothetical protein ACTFIZ_001177 [Dictyostelium cf. discoideum]
MKERNSFKCPHLEFSIKEAEDYNFKYLGQLTDFDQFPMFKPGICTVECKEKMIKIIDITFYNYYKLSRDYFEDCKMIFGSNSRGLYLEEYLIAIKNNEYTKKTEFLTNLQYIDGKVVRFCDVPKENNETKQEENK